MKKTLLLCILSFATILASAQLTYEFNEETGVLTIGGDGTTVTAEDVNRAIQSNYELKEVAFTATSITMIGDSAFSACSLTNITLPDGLTTIGNRVFFYCESLTSITLPDGLTTIGDFAFSSCESLTSITLPDGLTTIGNRVFSYCESLTSIAVSSQNAYFTSVDGVLFDKQKKVLHTYPAGRENTSYTVPKGTEKIGDYAFSACSLTNITLPDGLTTIGDYAFGNCSALTSITVSSQNAYFTSVDGVLFDKQKKVLLVYPAGREETSYIVPKGTESIENRAFSSCKSLTNITLPDGLTTIGDYAFSACSLTNITLPDGVTSIGNGAFGNCSALTSITLPDGLTTIGDYAFYGCSLTNITIPDGVTSIGNDAFSNCSSLTNITLPDGVTSIGERAFSECRSLTKITCLSKTEPKINFTAFESGPKTRTVYVPNATSRFTASKWGDDDTTLSFETIMDSAQLTYDFNEETGVLTIGGNGTTVTAEDVNQAIGRDRYDNFNETLNKVAFTATGITMIGDSAFYDCRSLANITLPDGLTTIGDYAFYDCSLTNITLPDGVTSIGDFAFSSCESLTSIAVSSQNAYFTSVDGVLFDKQKKVLLTYPNGRKEASYIVPKGTETIEDYAFSACSLTNITLPDGLTTIGNDAFGFCESLTSITLPNTLTTIGNYAFGNCSALTSITLPDGLTTIGKSVFSSCHSLTNITFPDGLTTIGNDAFSNCSSLTNITLPDGVTSIGERAFSECSSLTNITLPDGVTSIGERAFSECRSLTKITCLSKTEPKINFTAFESGPKTRTVYVPNATSRFTASKWGDDDTTLSFETIMDSAQLTYDFNEETGKLTIGGNGTTVTRKDVVQAIQSNNELKEVAFTATGITMIGDNAFKNCSALTSITLPDGLTSIGDNAFFACDSLTSITLLDGLTTIGDYAFYGCSLTNITLPDGLTTIGDYAFYGCSLTNITLPDGLTTIGDDAFCKSLTSITVSNQNAYFTSVDGVLFDKQKKVLHTYPAGRENTSYTVPKGTEKIGDYAFSYCGSLTSITLPDGLTTIGNDAFSKCESLTSITLPDGVTTIGEGSFYGCDYLTSITLPNTLTTIGNGAFDYCKSLTSITLPDGLTTIGNGTFSECSSLTSITLPDGLTTIGDNAFYGCSLTNITLPDGLTTIGDYAFYGCSLTNITLPDGVTTIEEGAFSFCYSLTNITLPDGVTSIGNEAFAKCYSLTEITCLSKTEPKIDFTAFEGGPKKPRTVYVPNATSGFTASKWGDKDTTVAIKYGK